MPSVIGDDIACSCHDSGGDNGGIFGFYSLGYHLDKNLWRIYHVAGLALDESKSVYSIRILAPEVAFYLAEHII